ncbi:unnamed protein product [Effrenium voratum]|nr:unnamed protein product [Effrenium voratum]
MVMTVLQEVNGEDASPEKRSSLSGGEANEAAQLRQALLEAQGEIAGLRLALAAKESVRRSEDGSNEPRSARLSLDPSSARRARRLSVEETATTARRTEGRRQAGLFELRVSLRSRARREEPKPSSVLTSTPPVPNSSRRGSRLGRRHPAPESEPRPSRSVSPKESRAAGTEVKAQFSPPRPEARTRSLSARAMRKFAELNAHKEEWPDVRREAAAAADSECRSKAGAAAAVSECRLKAGAAAADSECRLKAGRTHECRKDRPPGASPVDAHCIETVRRTSGPTVRMTHPVQVRVPVMPLGAPRFASTRATRLSLPAGLGHTWVSRV